MNQITTRYITENGACYEQYVITDPEAKTALTITPERGGMITSFTLDGEEFVWTRRPNFSECNRCLLYTSPSPRDKRQSRMPSSA